MTKKLQYQLSGNLLASIKTRKLYILVTLTFSFTSTACKKLIKFRGVCRELDLERKTKHVRVITLRPISQSGRK